MFSIEIPLWRHSVLFILLQRGRVYLQTACHILPGIIDFLHAQDRLNILAGSLGQDACRMDILWLIPLLQQLTGKDKETLIQDLPY